MRCHFRDEVVKKKRLLSAAAQLERLLQESHLLSCQQHYGEARGATNWGFQTTGTWESLQADPPPPLTSQLNADPANTSTEVLWGTLNQNHVGQPFPDSLPTKITSNSFFHAASFVNIHATDNIQRGMTAMGLQSSAKMCHSLLFVLPSYWKT